VQLTSANTNAEVDMLIAALEELAHLGELQPAELEPVQQPMRELQSATRQGAPGSNATRTHAT
jgi:hypothetical protein